MTDNEPSAELGEIAALRRRIEALEATGAGSTDDTPAGADGTRISADERFELLHRRLSEAVHERVERNLIRRYSIIGAVIALVLTSFVGFTVNAVLEGSRIRLATAEGLQQSASTRLNAAAEKAGELADRSQRLEGRLEDAVKKGQDDIAKFSASARQIRETLASVSTANLGISNGLRKEIGDVAAKVEELSSVVADITDELDAVALAANNNAAALKSRALAVETAVAAVQTSIDRSATEIEAAELSANLSQYPVEVRGVTPGLEQLAANLRSEGYTVTYNEGQDRGTGEDFGFDIDINTPLEITRRIVFAARDIDPNLDLFAFVEGDGGNAIIVGASFFGFEDDRLTAQEVEQLFEEGLSEEEYRSRAIELGEAFF